MEATETFTKWYAQEHKACGMRVTSKDKELTWLWLAIDKLLRFITFKKMDTFYTGFTTTLGRTVYFPAGWSIENAQVHSCITLRHEACHIKQNLKCGLGSIQLGTVVMGLLYLLFPLPVYFAWFRYKFEREAYRVSYYTAMELGLKPNIEFYIGLLTGPEYFWTWYSRKQVRAWFRRNCRYNA